MIIATSIDCPSGKLPVLVTRYYYNYPEEESLKLFEGDSATGTPVYTLYGVIYQYYFFYYDICLAPVLHTIEMKDSYGDGWNSMSYVKFTVLGLEYGPYTLAYGRTGTGVVDLSVIHYYGRAWKHTNEVQSGTSWTTQPQTWTEGSVFPDVSTVTRYFRTSMTLDNYQTVFKLMMKVMTKSGFVAYINGNAFWSYNMPAGVVNATTRALSVTDKKETMIHTLSKLYVTSASVEIAFEVHCGPGTIPSEPESFDSFYIFSGGDAVRRIDADGIFNSDKLSTGSTGTGMIFDGSLTTNWVFDFAISTWVTWTFGDGRRELINKYSISSSSNYPQRDPVAWKIYGSNDGINYIFIDYQSDIIWSGRKQTKSFIINNYIAYNTYKLELLAKAGSDLSMQFSEWNLIISDQPIVPPGIAYPQQEYTFYKDIDNVQLMTKSTGYTTWTITGGVLPEGLNFDDNTGIISGIPSASMIKTVFTISSVYLVDGQTYTTTVAITVQSCDLPDKVFIKFTKTNANVEAESYKIINSAEEVVVNGIPATSSTASTAICLPVGVYNVKMTHSSGGKWKAGSYLTVNVYLEKVQVQLMNSCLSVNTEITIPINIDYVLYRAYVNTGIKYILGSVPANWYTTAYDPSTWTTLVDNARPAISNKIQLYRTSFNIPTVTGFSGYELSVRARAGVVVYLNGVEIYRRYVNTGDITTDSIATGGLNEPWYRSITGKMSNLVQGNNVLAVALINIATSTELVDYNADLRLMKESVMSVRYWDYSTLSSVGQNVELFDQNIETQFRITKLIDTYMTITFNKARAELFNKYCIVTNLNAASEDPRDWTIEGKNEADWVVLKTETNVFFENRGAPYCFYIPNAAIAYSTYKIKITKPAVDSAKYYSLSQLFFYLEDLDHATVPELAFNPSDLVGYTNDPFPEVISSSPYYTKFSITPELPTGLSLNSNTGAIKGIMNQPFSKQTFTISAINHLGAEKSTTISVSVEACAGDKVPFTLEFDMQSGAEKLSFDLKDIVTGEIVTSRSQMMSLTKFTIPMCRTAQKYALVLKCTDTSGWGSSRVTVCLSDGSELLTESLAAGIKSKEYNFNVKYEVAPKYSAWNYKIDGEAAPAKWNTVEGAPAWPEAKVGSFPVATGITQYYFKKFASADLDSYSTLEISVVAKDGAVIYLNGKEKFRINMPEDDIDSTTRAIKGEIVPTSYTVGDLVVGGSIIEGENILAFELHRFSVNEPVNSFDGSAILVLNNMYMIKDGVPSSIPYREGSEGTMSVFDNNSDTKFYLENQQDGISMTWTYNNHRREPINNYGVVAGNDCNSRHPSSYSLSGSNNGFDWTILHTSTDVFFSKPSEQKRFDFYNERSFNMYRLVPKEFKNQRWSFDSQWCAGTHFQLADFYMFSKRVEPDCLRDGEFPPAMDGYFSIADCPQYYEGYRSRLCTGKTLGEEVIECSVKEPKGIAFDVETITLIQGTPMKPEVPNIIGKEISVTVFPLLPDGLIIDSETGKISGIPLITQEMKKYTVSARNIKNTVKTTIAIEILEKPINWILIIVLVVVAVIVIVAVVVLVAVLKKKKTVTKVPTSKKSSKAPTKGASQVKTKANIKV